MACRGKAAVIYNYTTLFPETLHPAENKKYDAIYCGQINPLRGGNGDCTGRGHCKENNSGY